MSAGLAPDIRHVGRVLATVWRVCGPAGWIGAGLSGALLAAAALLHAAPRGAAWLPDARLRWLLLIISLAVATLIAVGFWMRLVVNVMQQNHPQLARTVPGQVRALRAALCGVALLVAAVAGLISISLGGPLLTVVAAVLVMLALFATVLRWPLWGFGVMALSWSAPLLQASAAARLAAQGVRACPGLTAALGVSLSLFFMARIVMGGGSRHAAAHRRVSAMAGAMGGNGWAQGLARPGDVQGAANAGLMVGKGLYGRWLRRTLQQAGGGGLQARLALGLGPLLHWTGQLSGLLVGGAFVLLPLLFAWASPEAHAARRMGLIMVSAAPLMMLANTIGWPLGLWGTRREQALLCLLPGGPQGAALNRWLSRRLAVQFLAVVALMTGVSVFCIHRFDLDFQWTPVEDYVLGSAALSPFLVLVLWRDWSAMRPPTGGMLVTVLGGLLGIGGTAWVWVSVVQGSWWTLAGLSALVFAPLGLWRWRLAVHAPAAWPVGRASGCGAVAGP